MDAIKELLKDHEEVGKLFNEFIVAGDTAYKQKKTISEKIIEEITTHAQKEEKILFPALKENGGEDEEEMVLEGIEEHRVTEFMMNRIEKTKPEDESFDAKPKVLMESSKHHFMEEEREIFPKAKKILKDELEILGKQMDDLK